MARIDERSNEDMRAIIFETNFTKHAEGSVLVKMGETWVICNATVEESVPPHKRFSGEGWVTAEYSMLPRATNTRSQRDIGRLKLSPRSTEIQRLIGRALRSVINPAILGERSIIIDCDVIQADGGTRCASISGGFVALYMACQKLLQNKIITKNPIIDFIAAVSVGKIDSQLKLDLCYEEDSKAGVDMNVVMTSAGNLVEIQGTGEGDVFTQEEMLQMTKLAAIGIQKIIAEQKRVLNIY